MTLAADACKFMHSFDLEEIASEKKVGPQSTTKREGRL
jgi:hypothetical protein